MAAIEKMTWWGKGCGQVYMEKVIAIQVSAGSSLF